MIMLRPTGSRYFEEAYFVLSDGEYARSMSEDDMVREAGRVIEENMLSVYCDTGMSGAELGVGNRGGTRRLRAFLFGLISGGGAAGAVWAASALLGK